MVVAGIGSYPIKLRGQNMMKSLSTRDLKNLIAMAPTTLRTALSQYDKTSNLAAYSSSSSSSSSSLSLSNGIEDEAAFEIAPSSDPLPALPAFKKPPPSYYEYYYDYYELTTPSLFSTTESLLTFYRDWSYYVRLYEEVDTYW